jgi:hypothetical protein
MFASIQLEWTSTSDSSLVVIVFALMVGTLSWGLWSKLQRLAINQIRIDRWQEQHSKKVWRSMAEDLQAAVLKTAAEIVGELERAAETLPQEWVPILRHTLGARPEQSKKNHGYRNKYAVTRGTEQYETLCAMAAAGYMQEAKGSKGKPMAFFFATEKGCRAIGLSEDAIKRAFED